MEAVILRFCDSKLIPIKSDVAVYIIVAAWLPVMNAPLVQRILGPLDTSATARACPFGRYSLYPLETLPKFVEESGPGDVVTIIALRRENEQELFLTKF